MVERIQQAKKGPKRKHQRVYTDEKGVYRIGALAPMGEHPRVSDTDIGDEWGLGQTAANQLVNNPQRCNPYQTKKLCDVLGVTLDWLRYGGENAYGKYEDVETVAMLYDHLTPKDKEHLCYLLKKLVGEDGVKAVRHEVWRKDHEEWLSHNPKASQQLEEEMRAVYASIMEPIRRAWEEAQKAYAALFAPSNVAAELVKSFEKNMASIAATIPHLDAGNDCEESEVNSADLEE